MISGRESSAAHAFEQGHVDFTLTHGGGVKYVLNMHLGAYN